MRILFLTNYYPPYSRGGYELWCQEVAMALSQHGHQVHVLALKSLSSNPLHNDNGIQVHRKLYPEVEGTLLNTVLRLLKDRYRLEEENLQQVQKLVSDFQPEIAVIWGMWNVPRSVPALIESLLPGCVVYYICDYWLTLPNAYTQRWQEPAKRSLARLPKHLLGKYFLANLNKEPAVKLKLEYPICVSQAVREILVKASVPVEHAQVIYGGIKVDDFKRNSSERLKKTTNRLNLLYMGRLESEKGVHTAIRALKHLRMGKNTNFNLSIYGRGTPNYEAYLRSVVKQHRLEDLVTFCGAVPHDQVPQVFAQHDVLIFPSDWHEPFARTVLEAMAAGLVVIGTTTGGTGEILLENETGLTFSAGDAEQLASQIQHLSQNTSLRNKLAIAGQSRVVDYFTLSRMVDQIEAAIFVLAVRNNQPIGLPFEDGPKMTQENSDQ